MTDLKRKAPKQAETKAASVKTIMRDPWFQYGLDEIRSGKAFNPESDQWGYERGRLFGTLAPLNMPLKIDGKINPQALRLCELAFERRYII
jgi:hypothetical protein